MPTATSEALSAQEAIEMVAGALGNLQDVGAFPDDLDFLHAILTDESLFNIVDIHEDLEVQLPPTKDKDAVYITRDVIEELNDAPQNNNEAMILRDILDNPHFRALLVAHDDVSNKNFEGDKERINQLLSPFPPIFDSDFDNSRIINIRKSETEPLGITVKLDETNNLVVARILQGSIVDKQGLLHVEDVIRAVNGCPVASPEMLMQQIVSSDPDMTFSIIPSFKKDTKLDPVFMKAHFSFDPMKDHLIPCQEAGLPFQDGDVLEILSADDANWWQARLVEINGPVGLVPSSALEEKRKSFVKHDLDYSKSSLFCGLTKKKKKTIKYSSKDSKAFDKADVLIYEEVRRMSPFERPFLVLVGSKGVGRRSFKERLIKDDPRRFGAAIAHTSRAPRTNERDGQGYFFTDRMTMEQDILNNLYIEHGDFNMNLYGTRVDTAWDVVKSGRMCVLDVSPTALKMLKTQEYMPYIVFIAAPSIEALKVMYEERRRMVQGGRGRGSSQVVELKSENDFIKTVKDSGEIERMYNTFFDEIIVNDNFENTYLQLRRSLNDMKSKQQWVPVSWVH